MKFTKLLAVVLSLAIAATAMFSSAFAVTINGTVEEGDVTGIVIDLGADYPVLLDAASWAAGVEVDYTFDFENEIVEVVEGYGNGCGGNGGLYIKYGEAFTWKDTNKWSYDVNWMADKALTCNTIALTVDTAGADVMEAGFRLYNFQQSSDCDLDDQLIGNGITVEILDIRVGGVSILGDEPTTEEPTTEEPVTEEPTTEEPTPVVPNPETAYIKATVDNTAGTVVISTVNIPESICGIQYRVDFTGATYVGMEKATLPSGWASTYPPEITNGFTAVYDCDFSTSLGDQDIVTLNFTDVENIELAFSKMIGSDFSGGTFKSVDLGLILEVDGQTTIEEPTTDDTTTDEPIDTDIENEDMDPQTAYIKATVDNEAGTVVISTVNMPDLVCGIQYSVDFTGATYAGMEKAALPSGWSVTYPPEITTGFTAAYDCDFSTFLGDQDLVTLNFTDVESIELAFSNMMGVESISFEEIPLGLILEVDGEITIENPIKDKPTTDEPVTDEPVTDEPVTDEPIDTDDNTDVEVDTDTTSGGTTGGVGSGTGAPSDTDAGTEESVGSDTETEEEPTTPPVDTDAATEEPATDAETTTDTNTNTAVDGDDEEPGDVDTGVAGFASILGVVALAGVVASKKR